MIDTNWTPELGEGGPRYRALADAIAEAVSGGELRAGDRLPPVRDLAWKLKVTPGTVSRAYQLAEHRGVIEGQVGRGTFVRGRDAAPFLDAPPALTPAPSATIDLRLNRAPDVGQDAIVTAAIERLIAARGAVQVTDYHRFGEDLAERDAGAAWLRSGGVDARVDDVAICSGAQHGILTALAATVGGGDAIAVTEPLIHPGLKDCARAIGLRLEPVEVDEEGLLPDALDAACARWRPGAIVLTANAQNPLLRTMSLARREAIADVARRRRVMIVEDDVYGWLQTERAPSFPNICPEMTWYVASLSKCVAAGLRVGYVLAPPGEGPRAARILHGYTQTVSWLVSALAAELIRSGDAQTIVEKVRAETAARSALVAQILGSAARTDPAVAVGWLTLPEPWRASDFVATLETMGVLVSPAEVFAVGRAPAPHAVRVGVGNAKDRAEVTMGLERIRELMRREPAPTDALV